MKKKPTKKKKIKDIEKLRNKQAIEQNRKMPTAFGIGVG